jgi:GNAT superfamily N-acetyltransferase
VGLTIRDAQHADANAIAGLLGQLGYPTDGHAVEGRLERLLIVGDRVVVAELDGAVAGLAHLQVAPAIEHERPAGKLAALVVDEAHRGEGIGRALVDVIEAEAHTRGCALLYLTTAARRAEAHEFYRRVGLEETGKRFAKTLSPPR